MFLIIIEMKSKLWLILPGGGVKGTFQYGYIKGLLSSFPDAEIERVYGTSVGAIMAPLVAAKRFDLIDTLFENIQNINDVFQPWNWLENRIKILPIITRMGAFRKVKLVDAVLDLMKKNMTLDEMENAFSKVSVVAWDFINKKEEWFSGKDVPFGMKASSALAPMVPPVEKNGVLYTDGGITEIIPISKALHDFRQLQDDDDRLMLVVDCSTRVPQKSQRPKDILTFMSSLLSDACSGLTLRELELAKNNFPGKIHYVKPLKESFENAIHIDKDIMKKVVDEAYQQALSDFPRIATIDTSNVDDGGFISRT